MGGEKTFIGLVFKHQIGSPPRGRGKCVQADSAGAWAGITPAWAGKSVPEGARQFVFEDHPRVGGEKR